MATHDLLFISTADMDTTAASYDTAGGWDFYWGTTLSLHSDATMNTLSVNDANATFDDDDFGQKLAADLSYGCTTVPAGSVVEAEYQLVMQDSAGNLYKMLAVSTGEDAYKVHGFVFMDTLPPLGETLTWVSTTDMVSGVNYYADAVPPPPPACFAAGTLIATAAGPRPVEALRAGDLVETLDHGLRPLYAMARRQLRFRAGPHPHRPVLIAADAFGPGLPARPLVLSPQHRLLVRLPDDGAEALAPVKALLRRRGLRRMQGCRAIDYVHLIFDRHELVSAEGLASESFLAGPLGLLGLDPGLRQELTAATPHPAAMPPARPLLKMREAERLARRLVVPSWSATDRSARRETA